MSTRSRDRKIWRGLPAASLPAPGENGEARVDSRAMESLLMLSNETFCSPRSTSETQCKSSPARFASALRVMPVRLRHFLMTMPNLDLKPLLFTMVYARDFYRDG